MGLGLYFTLHAPAAWPAARVRDAVQKMHERALEQGFAEVGEVERDGSWKLFEKDLPDRFSMRHAESETGFLFRTWLGLGCETAFFGLFWYPAAFVDSTGAIVPTGWGEG